MVALNIARDVIVKGLPVRNPLGSEILSTLGRRRSMQVLSSDHSLTDLRCQPMGESNDGQSRICKSACGKDCAAGNADVLKIVRETVGVHDTSIGICRHAGCSHVVASDLDMCRPQLVASWEHLQAADVGSA